MASQPTRNSNYHHSGLSGGDGLKPTAGSRVFFCKIQIKFGISEIFLRAKRGGVRSAIGGVEGRSHRNFFEPERAPLLVAVSGRFGRKGVVFAARH